jgi:hypothetical protein
VVSTSASALGGWLLFCRHGRLVVKAASTARSSAAACAALRTIWADPAGRRRWVATGTPAAERIRNVDSPSRASTVTVWPAWSGGTL